MIIPGLKLVTSDFIYEQEGRVRRLHLPLYCAVAKGNCGDYHIACQLPGEMMERKLQSLGYSDNSPHRLVVQLLTYEVPNETAYLFNPTRRRMMSKQEFDDWLASVQQDE